MQLLVARIRFAFAELRKNHAAIRTAGPRNSRIRKGFSLLEVILALALTAVIVAAIAMATQLHLVMLTRQQETIEQSHVARNVLDLMAKDIRGAMQYKPFDVDTVDVGEATSDAIDSAGGAIPNGAIPGGTGTGGANPGAAMGMGEESEASPNEDIQNQGEPMPHPGFYGNNREIMFNLSRLPRMDQYNPFIVAGSNNVSIPSDIKTTSFFLDNSGNLEGDPLQSKTMGGLYRRQLEHAVAAYANENNYRLSSDATTRLLAPEVADLTFRYFDGDGWVDQWDSDEEGGFPTAVEITIVVDSRRKEGATDVPAYTGFDEEYMRIYRRVVHLPVAEILSEEEQAAVQNLTPSVTDSSSNGGGTP